MEKVTVYSKNNCMQCKMTKRFLGEHNIEFVEKNINEQPEYVDYLKEKGFMSLPVVEAEGMNAISGFRPDQLSQLA
ncbi:redoxin NrdH [Apilactobacillus micheneri]|uniref:Glutaredoxin-like protein NrdH n=1 Tax=Apilactobacillus micheneri TaxID=1899430 RepID=A0A2S2JL28_9LACO|nr:redoxin NrdH [Apilactobacillus micheneri]TPR24215.1 NrdH-redoxin [Apilactobacillus micheneri]TPR25234.1 NrdH-redoxin [Apilactobacillus micheneri]TPR27546.1 NrdH-redoxin [Apilactobacillus micheneri]TPR28811.1 NrdH-redoxin [Apilactobacillus micheneri]TPR29833.1 NrdH-redoxin [Apilactobacillus micheneri]